MTRKYPEECNKTGVYLITNFVNSRVYVGSTTDSFGRRWYSHRYMLSRNKHGNTHLQNAWNKYGEDTFKFSIMEEMHDVELIYEREQHWIDHYRKSEGGCYNIMDVGTNICDVCYNGIESIDIRGLDIFGAIEHEHRIRRDVRSVKRFSAGLDSKLLDELDSIENVVGYSGEFVRSTAILYGALIIRKSLGKAIDDIDTMRMKMLECDVDEIRNITSSLSRVIYNKIPNHMRQTVRVPKDVVMIMNKISKAVSIDFTTLCKVCMMYSLSTRADVVESRKEYFDYHTAMFVAHVRSQYILFKGQEHMLDKVVNTEEFKSMFLKQ